MKKYQLFLCINAIMLIQCLTHAVPTNGITKFDPYSDITGRTLKLFQVGERTLEISGNEENTLFLGSSGAGTTTAALITGTDDTKLISRDIGELYGDQKLGEYVIVDDKNLISTSTLAAKTIIPNLFIDKNTGHSYYDCPGYDERRQTSTDMVSTYYLKKIIEFTKKIKFIFVIDFAYFDITDSRQNIFTLLHHITGLIMDIDKYSDAIGVIVTKINKPQLPDDQILSNIELFLNDIRNNLETHIDERNWYKDGIKFIDILLQKNNDNLDRISLLRTPRKPGRLSENPIIQNSKEKILNMITNMKFIAKNNEDFNYSVSHYTENDAVLIANALHDEIDLITKDINNDIISSAQPATGSYRGDNIITVLTKDIEQITTPDDFMNKLYTTFPTYNIPDSEEKLYSLNKRIKVLKFVDAVSPVKLSFNPKSWMENFKEPSPY